MDDYLPINILRLVKCYILNEDPILKEKEGLDITICCSDGQVLEFYHKEVVNSCNISFLNPSNINVFYAYDPFVKYYIVEQNSDIIVLTRKENLKMLTNFYNVQSYEINDFLEVGKPQVKIWLKDELEPVITDFSDSSPNGCTQETELLSNLNSRLNLMKLCLKEIENTSKMKRLCCDNALKNLNNNGNSCLSLESRWQRVVDDFWIVCISVRNNSDHLIENLHLFLNEDSQIETKILKLSDNNPDDLSNFDLFKPVTCLTPHSLAYLVGILSLPKFKFNKTISISFSLLYRNNKNESNFEEIEVPPFVLDIVELANGNLGLFIANSISIEDVITIMIVNEEVILEINNESDNVDLKLNEILIDKLHFRKFEIDVSKTFCYVVKPETSCYISRFMLHFKQISPTSYYFKCYIRDKNHLSIFVNILQHFSPYILSIYKKNECFKNEIPILAAVNKLDEEFKNFSSVMKRALPASSFPLKTETKLLFTPAMWKELLEGNLQFDTDLKFQDALMENHE